MIDGREPQSGAIRNQTHVEAMPDCDVPSCTWHARCVVDSGVEPGGARFDLPFAGLAGRVMCAPTPTGTRPDAHSRQADYDGRFSEQIVLVVAIGFELWHNSSLGMKPDSHGARGRQPGLRLRGRISQERYTGCMGWFCQWPACLVRLFGGLPTADMAWQGMLVRRMADGGIRERTGSGYSKRLQWMTRPSQTT